MIVSDGYSKRYSGRGNVNTKKCLKSIRSTEHSYMLQTSSVSRAASRKPSEDQRNKTKENDYYLNIKNDYGCRSTTTISTCIRGTSKKKLRKSYVPSATQTRKEHPTNYSSKRHNRLNSEATCGTAKKRTKDFYRLTHNSMEETPEKTDLQTVYDRVSRVLETYQKR